MTIKKSSNVVISPPKPEISEHKAEVGEAVSAPSSSSVDDVGMESRPFTPQVFDTSEAVRFEDPMELESFMHDQIHIQTNPPQGENEDVIVTFRVRDKVQNVMLGGTQVVSRWCVEVMARCRNSFVKGDAVPVSTSSDQHVYKNTTSMNSRALKYPFAILHDPKGALGHKWFAQVCRDRI